MTVVSPDFTFTTKAGSGVTAFQATADATNVYFQITYSGTPSYWRVYIDTDGSGSTGYNYGGIGSEYILENNSYYRYSGTAGAWGWTFIEPNNSTKTTTIIKWTLPRAKLPTGLRSFKAVSNVDSSPPSAFVTITLP